MTREFAQCLIERQIAAQIEEYIATNAPIRCKLTVMDTSEAEADRIARLLLAAPRMLRALEKALPVLRDAIALGVYPRDDLSDRLAFDAVEAAIAEAKGTHSTEGGQA